MASSVPAKGSEPTILRKISEIAADRGNFLKSPQTASTRRFSEITADGQGSEPTICGNFLKSPQMMAGFRTHDLQKFSSRLEQPQIENVVLNGNRSKKGITERFPLSQNYRTVNHGVRPRP